MRVPLGGPLPLLSTLPSPSVSLSPCFTFVMLLELGLDGVRRSGSVLARTASAPPTVPWALRCVHCVLGAAGAPSCIFLTVFSLCLKLDSSSSPFSFPSVGSASHNLLLSHAVRSCFQLFLNSKIFIRLFNQCLGLCRNLQSCPHTGACQLFRHSIVCLSGLSFESSLVCWRVWSFCIEW